MRTRMVKRCGLRWRAALAGSALAFSRKASSESSSAHSWKRFSLASAGVLLGSIAAAEAPINSWAVMARVFGCSLSSPLRKIRRIVPNWLAKVTIWAWAGVTSKETVLPRGNRLRIRGLGVLGLGARDVVDGKYADVLQDGLAEGFADAQLPGSARMKTCTSQREPGSTSPLWMASGPTGMATTRSPLGTRPSVGTWPRARSLGSMIGSPAIDLLPRAAAVEVFLADHRPGGNSILGPLFELDVVFG